MVSAVAANLMQPTRYTTWRPTWRLHLAHAFLAALITLFSVTAAWPLYTSGGPVGQRDGVGRHIDDD